MRYFRTVEDCSKLGRVTNEDIRRKLKIESVENKAYEHRQNWINQLHGMTEEIISTRMLVRVYTERTPRSTKTWSRWNKYLISEKACLRIL
jgi:hypothetical protein